MKELPLTSIPIWSPSALPVPLLATGTVSGALDENFSSDSTLELWDPFSEDAVESLGKVSVSSRFNRLAWGGVSDERNTGVIAGGLENGEIWLWNPEGIILGEQGSEDEDGEEKIDAVIAKYEPHKGPVRGLDFNTHQPNLLASGATNGEIFIWDLLTPNKPFSPGVRSRSLEDITCLQWNSHVAHVLATGSNSGYTVVWDLKSKREVTALSYMGGGQQGLGAAGFGGGWSSGSGKRGISAVQWHPDTPTKLVTASDDDTNPIVMLWDLRNWKEPEKILSGHEKGILSLSWCKSDSDLLLSSGKDGRTIAWNPTSGDIVAEVKPSSNWTFDVQWCPRNPSMLTTASMDGKISFQSIQSTAPISTPEAPSTLAPGDDGAGIFEQAISANAANYPTKSLTQHPKWLKRPSNVAFGFGGKLVEVAVGPDGRSEVKVRSVVGQQAVVDRALRLEQATQEQVLKEFCDSRANEVAGAKDEEKASWKLLGSLFGTEAKGELVSLLGFSKEEVKAKVEDAIKAVKDKLAPNGAPTMTKSASGISNASEDDATSVAREPLVSFADTPTDGLSASSEGEAAAANDGASQSGASISTAAGVTTEVTEPSLFGDDTIGGSTAAADFYSQIGSGRPAALPDHVFGRDLANSSVAATIGSASSVASLNLKPTTFKIYPTEESDVDKLITRALVVGDFESAVELSLSTDRFADAILLAVRGGPELLAKTQKTYFERQTSALPYLRVFQSIVANDLTDVVQNADLEDWQEIFVVLCTFAKSEEFSGLTEQLGQRLEYQYVVAQRSPNPESATEWRKNAILCYLAAGQLEKVVGIWLQEMDEDEKAAKAKAGGDAQLATSQYEAHAKALQSFVEKVTVFQHAVGYIDVDLAQPTASAEIAESGARTYKLASLYERYVEYAELLAAQGLVTVALKYIAMTPADFEGLNAESSGPALTRHRLERATGKPAVAVFPGQTKITGPSVPVASTSASAYAPSTNGYQYPTEAAYAQKYPQQTSYQPVAASPYAPAPVSRTLDDPYGASAASNPYAPKQPEAQSYAAPSPYLPQGNTAYAPPSFPSQTPQQPAYPTPAPGPYAPAGGFMPAPPPVRDQSPSFAAPPRGAPAPPPPRVKSDVQWNDAPVLPNRKLTPAASPAPPKPSAITSPFPNSGPSTPSAGFGGYGQPGQAPPPPPPSRGGNRTPAPQFAPPPPAGQAPPPRFQGAPPVPTMSPPPPQGYPSHPSQQHPPPPPGQQRFPGPPRPPPQGGPQYQSMPAGGFPPSAPIQPRPPGPPQPPQQQQPQGRPAPPPGPYAPPPSASAPGPYAPPPGAVRPPGPPGFNGQPPNRSQPSPAPPAPAPPKPEPPKSKYPPGDRSHIPAASKPIFDVLSNELRTFRQVYTQPQEVKMVNDIEKRLNLLFDMLNCETLRDPSLGRLLEIVKAIEARNQQAALELHLQLITLGAGDVAPFQAALKILYIYHVIRRSFCDQSGRRVVVNGNVFSSRIRHFPFERSAIGITLRVVVWFGWDSNAPNAFKTAQDSIYSVFTNSSVSDVAPYVVHSADFGSEPIGDGVDSSTDQFVTDLKAFRASMKTWGIPVGISEDWDRTGTMSGSDGTGLGSTGKSISENSDYVHAHIMPYYHGNEAPLISDAWPYILKQMTWFQTTLPSLPLFITEVAISIIQFTTYWNSFASNCSTFKSAKAGWFLHAFSDAFESGFGLLDDKGESKIEGYKPERC
ncbi:hypothetical protein MNV49_003665 [Pseudohyphozyma bogoriensis]|nr:hypothetical protein MNV49_003665 [Pseudohyphozyma bogoriensis]